MNNIIDIIPLIEYNIDVFSHYTLIHCNDENFAKIFYYHFGLFGNRDIYKENNLIKIKGKWTYKCIEEMLNSNINKNKVNIYHFLPYFYIDESSKVRSIRFDKYQLLCDRLSINRDEFLNRIKDLNYEINENYVIIYSVSYNEHDLFKIFTRNKLIDYFNEGLNNSLENTKYIVFNEGL